jgi:hypothetical protein
METTVRNPQRGRTQNKRCGIHGENTAWFDTSADGRETYIITDVKGDLLVSEPGYTYPLRIYDMSKADIGYNQKKTTELKRRYE